MERNLYAKKNSLIRPVVLIQYRLATDRWTDIRTHNDSIYCASIASHSKNALVGVNNKINMTTEDDTNS